MNVSAYDHYRDWKQWNSRPFGAYSVEQARYFAEELNRSGIGHLNGRTLLEMGFGNGAFAGWARDAGADYLGTERLEALVEAGRASGFDTHDWVRPLDELRGAGAVDCIVALDVFEHLAMEDLIATLHAAGRALRPGGRLIARVPSGDSPFSRAIQHGDATHRLTLGSSMVGQLAAETGFHIECVREPAFPVRGLGIRAFVRRALVQTVRRTAFAVMTRAFMGGGRPVLTPDMVIVLVKP